MESHYHMGLETPRANISQIMHYVNSAYSIYLNTKHERCGHLFQGRFKAILVQADLYARTLTKYIHSNPVLKGMVERPEHFEWSSCQAYYGLVKAPVWLTTRTIVSCFGGTIQALRKEHEAYLASPDDPSFRNQLKASSRIGVLGDDDFIDKIRRTYLKAAIETGDHELGGLRKLRDRPKIEMIRDEIRRELGAANKLEKKCTIFFAHRFADYKLREIGEFYKIGPSAVSVAFHAIDRALASNDILLDAFERIKARLIGPSPNLEKGKN
jgi:hypothetical protein